jgi:DNA-directed RNA polymerase I, II, and III subunit RPABC2
MSYFEGDSDDDKKFKDSDDESEFSDTETVVSEVEDEETEIPDVDENLDGDVEDDDILSDNSDSDNNSDEEYEQDGGDDDNIESTSVLKKKDKTEKRTKKIPSKQESNKKPIIELSDDDTDDDDTGENYLQKFDKEINENYLINFHPECVSHNYDEVIAMSKVIRDENGIIIDDFHRTIPFMTKFEKARILGQRAKQINSGATPFVKVPENVIDGYLIAELELKQKRIPFIIRRPLPNGGSEYWSIKDLEDISF